MKKIKLVWLAMISLLIITRVYGQQQSIQSLFNQIKPSKYTPPVENKIPASGYTPQLTSLFALKEKLKSYHPSLQAHSAHRVGTVYPDTLIVGVAPYDTVTITGTLVHNGPIFVALKGVLIIKNASLTNLGDIAAFNNGQVIIDSSTVSFPQQYFYQRDLVAVNKANITISNTTLSYGGFSHNCQVADTAVINFINVTQPDWMTTGMNNWGTININGTNQAGEFILEDYITLNIKNASNALLWHQFPDTAVINWSFGKRDTTYGYQFNNTKLGVKGVEYNVNADSVYNVWWGMMPTCSSAVNITNSKVRSVGLWFNNPHDSTMVSGITDDATYSTTFTAPLSDRTLTFSNCTVETWSFYVFYKSIINVSGCIAGEIGTENSSKMYGTDYLVDGSGGYHWSADTSFIFADNATVYTDVRSEGNSIFIYAYGSVGASGLEEAIDNSLLVVVQSGVPIAPTEVNGGTAEFDNINQPGSVYADSTVPISGSAWIHNGPTSTWMKFKNWQLFYHPVDSVKWIPVTEIDTVPVSNGLLTSWNTHSIASGNYDFDLRIRDTWNDSLDAQMQVTLLPFVLGIPSLSNISDVVIFPNPADKQLNINFSSSENEYVQIELDNLLGQKIVGEPFTMVTGKNQLSLNTSTIASGSYICRIISAKGTMQKLVVVK